MALRRSALTALVLCLALSAQCHVALAQFRRLRLSFYKFNGCPQAETVVRKIVYDSIRRDIRRAGQLLRLHFHDCFVNGCDGSVLLDSQNGSPAEKDADINESLAAFSVIDRVKTTLERQCPGVVSCADILALASREAVRRQRGPYIPIRTGRLDATTSFAGDTTALPGLTDLDQVIGKFADQGLNVIDMIALSAGHTIGRSRCVQVQQRIGGFDDGLMDPNFRQSVENTCFDAFGGFRSNTKLGLDAGSVDKFDNHYFKNVLNGRGLLLTDSLLADDFRTFSKVNQWARDQSAFFGQFRASMLKMSEIPPNSNFGEVRQNCHFANNFFAKRNQATTKKSP